ncbi:plasmid stabilization protein [Burkholderia cenocepacia]|uniref:plasmid stabilization protein n=1 Tax=Burkholderia cenocepacia TaxID=95486 RepID=UPI0028602C76|nr:plasmid stabilization protein [Burkholderia cenocepacia]MDR8105055.1 plasmid stabilization protein [Burkholderia cenocepacia]
MRIRERLCVELAGMRPAWEAWCARRGVTTAEGVRQLITAALDAQESDRDVPAGIVTRSTAIDEPRTRVEVRLTRSEFEEVDKQAAASGLTSNRWIVALIRAQLTREPQLGQIEMRLLSDSNQHLAAVSRWLAQLARDASAGRLAPDSEPNLGVVRKQIDAHLRAVTAVIRANLDRWSR